MTYISWATDFVTYIFNQLHTWDNSGFPEEFYLVMFIVFNVFICFLFRFLIIGENNNFTKYV